VYITVPRRGYVYPPKNAEFEGTPIGRVLPFIETKILKVLSARREVLRFERFRVQLF